MCSTSPCAEAPRGRGSPTPLSPRGATVPVMTSNDDQTMRDNVGAAVDLLISIESLLSAIDQKLDKIVRKAH